MCWQDPANLPNWMHHVRRLPRGDCAAPNLRPFQYAGRLYFRTLTDVAPGTELVVSFKPQAASGSTPGPGNQSASSLQEPQLHHLLQEWTTPA